MEVIMAVVVGGLYAGGIYMMMRRSITKLIMGLALLGYAANLLVFTAGGLVRGRSPVIPEGMSQPAEAIADPVPQALILTAIVIGFGVQAFAIVLIKRTYQAVGNDDIDHIRPGGA